MKEKRNSEAIKAELNKAKEERARKVDERDELAKKLEALDGEIASLLHIQWGGARVGTIEKLEKELYIAEVREYREQLPKPVLTIHWEDDPDYRIEKITAKRIYITSMRGGGGSDFYISLDGSDSWTKRWGLDIPATIALWNKFAANNSTTREPK
jgi:hypothetical protein